MAWKSDGSWSPENDDVASRVNTLTAQDSPLMQQARSSGIATASRRGLGNSSIAAGAGEAAALGAAVPIASQDAQQTHAKNMEQMGEQNQRQLTAAQIASADRANIAQTMASISRNYTDGIGSTLVNDKIPAGTRGAVQTDMANLYKSQRAELGSIYNVDLSWGASSPAAATPTLTAGAVPAATRTPWMRPA